MSGDNGDQNMQTVDPQEVQEEKVTAGNFSSCSESSESIYLDLMEPLPESHNVGSWESESVKGSGTSDNGSKYSPSYDSSESEPHSSDQLKIKRKTRKRESLKDRVPESSEDSDTNSENQDCSSCSISDPLMYSTTSTKADNEFSSESSYRPPKHSSHLSEEEEILHMDTVELIHVTSSETEGSVILMHDKKSTPSNSFTINWNVDDLTKGVPKKVHFKKKNICFSEIEAKKAKFDKWYMIIGPIVERYVTDAMECKQLAGDLAKTISGAELEQAPIFEWITGIDSKLQKMKSAGDGIMKEFEELLSKHLTGVFPQPGQVAEATVFLPRARVISDDKIGGKRQPYPPEGQVEVIYDGSWYYMAEADHDEAIKDFLEKRAGMREAPRKRNYSGEFSRGGPRGRRYSSPRRHDDRDRHQHSPRHYEGREGRYPDKPTPIRIPIVKRTTFGDIIRPGFAPLASEDQRNKALKAKKELNHAVCDIVESMDKWIQQDNSFVPVRPGDEHEELSRDGSQIWIKDQRGKDHPQNVQGFVTVNVMQTIVRDEHMEKAYPYSI